MHNKLIILSGALGAAGAAVSSLFGGWDGGMTTLVVFMAVDYATGLMTAAAGRSNKSAGGHLQSRAGWLGICRKCVTLLMVLVAAQLDRIAGSDFIRDAVVIAYIVNECLSIIENAGMMGVPVPKVVVKIIEELKNGSQNIRGSEKDDESGGENEKRN